MDEKRRVGWSINFSPCTVNTGKDPDTAKAEERIYLGIFLVLESDMPKSKSIKAHYKYELCNDSWDEFHCGVCSSRDFFLYEFGCDNRCFPKQDTVIDRLRDTQTERLLVHITLFYEDEKYRLYDPLALDFHNLLQDNEQTADIIFDVDGERVFAHKLILGARSPYFKAMFQNFCESAEKTIKVSNVRPAIFRAIIHYCYTNTIDFDGLGDKTSEICEILFAADYYDCQNACSMTEEVLIARLTEKNIFEIFTVAKQCKMSTALQTTCKKFIVQWQKPMTVDSVDMLPEAVLQIFLSSSSC